MSYKSDEKKAIDGWTILRAGGREAAGLEIPTIPTEVSTTSGPVRFALGENGEARVLLPLAEREALRGLMGASALQLTVSTFSSSGKKARFLDMTCLSEDLETVFAEVTDEILVRISSGENCVDAARSTIDDFRALLVRSSSPDIPISTIVGLVGELIVLDRLLDRSPRAWHCWRGPIGDRHDFRGRDSSLEVKTSLRAGKTSITVSTFEQMEAPAGGNLHLIHFLLEPVVAGIFSVSALGQSVLAKADDPERVKELISALGCQDVDAKTWNSHSFRLETEELYEVTGRFPRLVPSMLPGAVSPMGVSEVSYKIDLSAATEYAKGTSGFVEIEEAFLKCL